MAKKLSPVVRAYLIDRLMEQAAVKLVDEALIDYAMRVHKLPRRVVVERLSFFRAARALRS